MGHPSPRGAPPTTYTNIVAGANFHFSMADIIKATDNFSPSRKIGQGGFGLVYKGKLPDNQVVAIKRAKKVHLILRSRSSVSGYCMNKELPQHLLISLVCDPGCI